MRAAADFHRNGDASGMPDPEVCVSGGDFLCLSGVLAHQKMKIETKRRQKWIETSFFLSRLLLTSRKVSAERKVDVRQRARHKIEGKRADERKGESFYSGTTLVGTI